MIERTGRTVDRVEYARTAGGIRLAYEVAGAGDPPLVFVHGWCGDRGSFAPQLAHFARRHAVAALDLRGHGASDRPEPDDGTYDVPAFADDVLAVAAAAGFVRPVVVGHSLGGLVALACAARPGAVRAAVLVDPAPVRNERAKGYFARSAPEVAVDADASWRTAFAERLFLATDTAARDEVLAGMGRVPPAVAAAAMRGMAEFDGGSALDAASVPLLILHADTVERGLRDGRPYVTTGQTVGAGHFAHREVPDQVNAMIERFLAVRLG
ncbi:alpha/beta hydrolase [Micromonospora sp. NPDC049559]|uniref:alpha/beta fold hydrolase n=1 Tax=Micromonospora sp. NPDC049559 TaxID=3155923 RepID=UPI003434418F